MATIDSSCVQPACRRSTKLRCVTGRPFGRSSYAPSGKGWLMERSVTVRTPESIAFHYELAGLGSRFLAILADFVLQVALLIGLIVLNSYTHDGIDRFLLALHLKTAQANSILGALTVLAIFAIF